MVLIDHADFGDAQLARADAFSDVPAFEHKRKDPSQSRGDYVRRQSMLGQNFEFEVTFINVDSMPRMRARENAKRSYRGVKLIVGVMVVLPFILAILTFGTLGLTWYFLAHDAVLRGVVASGASIVFGSLFVVGMKLFIELRGATHGFTSFSVRD